MAKMSSNPKEVQVELAPLGTTMVPDPPLPEPYLATSSLPRPATTAPYEPQHQNDLLFTATRYWLELRRDLAADFHATNWSFTVPSFLFYLWNVALAVAIIIFSLWESNGDRPILSWETACKPDGSFQLYSILYSNWVVSGFFQITMGFGRLTFTQAKVIDITWDIVVGRCGQAILTWYSLRAFSAYIRVHMGTTPITYDTFWAFFVRDDASLIATLRVIRDFAARRSLRSRVAMIFIVLTMAFVLAFPTLASAMTGYTANSASFVEDTAGNLISFAQLKPLAYMIHDGWRIGLTGDYPVPWATDRSSYAISDPMLEPRSGFPVGGDSCYYKAPSQDENNMCGILWSISNYTSRYGFLGLDAHGDINDVESQWMNTTLPKPTLNITAFYMSSNDSFYGRAWLDPRTRTQPFSNRSNVVFFSPPSNATFSVDYVEQNGQCQPTRTYQWGFSFLQLFIVMLCLLVWSVGIHYMSLMSHLRRLALADGTDVPARYKAALELSHSMQHELSHSGGEDAIKLTGRQLEHRVHRALRGGRMQLPAATDELPTAATGTSAGKPVRLVRAWLHRERWWFTALVVLTSFLVGGFLLALWNFSLLSSLYWAALCWTVGVYAAMAVGRTKKTRGFILVCGMMLGIIVYIGNFLRHRAAGALHGEY